MKVQLPKVWEGTTKRIRNITGTVRVCQYIRNVGDTEKCLTPGVVEDLKSTKIFCERCVYNLYNPVSWVHYRPLNDIGKEILGFKRRS